MYREIHATGVGTRPIRCAIYTRKSTDEGLDQAFNSLDAQYEACSSYIASQRHEGWTLDAARYDDGGFSGGTMERPALKRLLADVAAGKVDVIVLYKIDRLTRALSDFARIVEVLDRAGASFVSVTQAFNTTTSMGRLTLNVLLSFAQFEREVGAERVRDKIAASKRKGMWMGGVVPLGYRVEARKLLPVPTEADIVRHIFARYARWARCSWSRPSSVRRTSARARERRSAVAHSTPCSPIASMSASMMASSSVACSTAPRRCLRITAPPGSTARMPMNPACWPVSSITSAASA
jgi:DNA invertase Pin-like site-specific DNA recombinase